jgi:hypothetical protein
MIQGPEEHFQEARDIVDGQRDATLYLLWKILYACQLRNVRYDAYSECREIDEVEF